MSELLYATIPEPIFPPLAVASYITTVAGAGALANCALVSILLKLPKTGLFSILLQLAVSDFILLGGISGLALWSQNEQTWTFGTIGCIVYRGLDVLTSTASIYLIANLGLHSLAMLNVDESAVASRDKRIICEDNEMQSSRHSLVANSDTSTPPRTMNIDYRIFDNKILVTPPCVFIWILAASLSVPEFIFATTVDSHNNTQICTFTESNHRMNIHTMLAIFNLFVPLIIICIVSVIIITKLKSERIIAVGDKQLQPALKLSLWLTLMYLLLCLPRSVMTTYFVYSKSGQEEAVSLYHVLDSHKSLVNWNLAACCAHLAVGLFRPLLCIISLPRLRQMFTFHGNSTYNL